MPNFSIDSASLTALIAGIGSLIGAFVVLRKSRPEADKLRAEARKAVAEESQLRTETIKREIDTVRETYSHMLRDQLDSVVGPMEARINRLVKQVNELQIEVDQLKQFRSLFDIALLYIRSLCHWIDTIEASKENKPKLPEELRAYFNDNKEKR